MPREIFLKLFSDIHDFSITQELDALCIDENYNEGRNNLFESNNVLFEIYHFKMFNRN